MSGLPPLTHGTVVNDRYEIRQSLGKGGWARCFSPMIAPPSRPSL